MLSAFLEELQPPSTSLPTDSVRGTVLVVGSASDIVACSWSSAPTPTVGENHPCTAVYSTTMCLQTSARHRTNLALHLVSSGASASFDADAVVYTFSSDDRSSLVHLTTLHRRRSGEGLPSVAACTGSGNAVSATECAAWASSRGLRLFRFDSDRSALIGTLVELVMAHKQAVLLKA